MWDVLRKRGKNKGRDETTQREMSCVSINESVPTITQPNNITGCRLFVIVWISFKMLHWWRHLPLNFSNFSGNHFLFVLKTAREEEKKTKQADYWKNTLKGRCGNVNWNRLHPCVFNGITRQRIKSGHTHKKKRKAAALKKNLVTKKCVWRSKIEMSGRLGQLWL